MNITDFGVTGIAAITVICYLVGCGAKASDLCSKWIPTIMGVVGVALGIAGLFTMPGFPAQDVITAAAVGAVSGFAATGIDQVAKQLGDAER